MRHVVGDIDEDIVGRQILIEPAHALQVEANALDLLGRVERGVDRRHRLRPDRRHRRPGHVRAEKRCTASRKSASNSFGLIADAACSPYPKQIQTLAQLGDALATAA
jgi:hypothetical protein